LEGLIKVDFYNRERRLKIDKTTLEGSSVPKLTDSINYVIGVVKDGQVTLVPLKSIIQMKTVLPYLNEAEKARAANMKGIVVNIVC
jgi:hypothetical protein